MKTVDFHAFYRRVSLASAGGSTDFAASYRGSITAAARDPSPPVAPPAWPPAQRQRRLVAPRSGLFASRIR